MIDDLEVYRSWRNDGVLFTTTNCGRSLGSRLGEHIGARCQQRCADTIAARHLSAIAGVRALQCDTFACNASRSRRGRGDWGGFVNIAGLLPNSLDARAPAHDTELAAAARVSLQRICHARFSEDPDGCSDALRLAAMCGNFPFCVRSRWFLSRLIGADDEAAWGRVAPPIERRHGRSESSAHPAAPTLAPLNANVGDRAGYRTFGCAAVGAAAVLQQPRTLPAHRFRGRLTRRMASTLAGRDQQ